ncbi:MAG TPA: hypothetical protein VHK88_08055 [Aquihabitans sp.]|nr:hypothetical protein [Aquihabitans sp.]
MTPVPGWLLGADGPYGDGTIDNLVLQPAAHRTSGIVVLVAMVAATVHLVRLAMARRALDRTGRVLLAVAQLTLMVQALLGIKLLDQNMGSNQLYIHYIGGLMPLGFFLAAGWFGRSDSPARTRWLAGLTAVGMVSAAMAFFIGRAYVNRGLT